MNPSVNPSVFARPLRGFVAGLAIALAGGASLTAFAGPDGGDSRHGHHAHHGSGAHHGGPGFMGGGRHMDRLLQEVGATDAQRTQIREIWQSAAADLKSRRESVRALREQQMQLFTQPTVDASAVEALRQKLLAEHDTSSKRISQAMLDASRVLTPEQRAKLAERMKARHEMMQRHMQERRALEKKSG
jgi:protein CpxP